MALKEVKDAIVTVLGTVAGMGKRYPRFRYIRDEKKENSELVQDEVLNAWFVSRQNAQNSDEDVNQELVTEWTTLLVRAYYAVSDDEESETTFDKLVDDAIEALNAARRPAGGKLGGTVEMARPPQLQLTDFRMYGPRQVLCHYAEITIAVNWRFLN